MKIEDYDFPDIVPLLMEVHWADSREPVYWQHRYIDQYLQLDEDGFDYADVFRMYLTNDHGDKLVVVFKSIWIRDRDHACIDAYSNFSDYKEHLFDAEFVNVDSISDVLQIVLFEDAWRESPPDSFAEGQFLYTEFGELISENFGFESRMDFFSMDCCIHEDCGKYGWSS